MGGKAHQPRQGSMGVWPRKRAKRHFARVRSWANVKEAKMLGFAGYKVGMTHLIVIDNRPNALTKGMEISIPVTVVECPPLKTVSIVLYKKDTYGLQVATAVMADKLDKEVSRKITLPKKVKKKVEDIKPEEYADIRLLVHTQPKLTGFGKKKPELFEMGIGGSITEKWNYAKEKLGTDLKVQDIINEGQQVDSHVVTKGKGFQGPVKRFGIGLRSHKSEKTIRGPGSLGGWKGHGHFMYRIAHAGQMGFHQRTEYNKQVLKISDKPEEINPKGGFVRYGEVRSTFLLVKGSLGGSIKRLIRLNVAIRPNKKMTKDVPAIEYISLESKQG